jgi:hypothetical protein
LLKNTYQKQELNIAKSKANKRLFFVLLTRKFLVVLICLQFLLFPLQSISATKDGSCKNYTDCNYKEGSFCIRKGKKNTCQNVCPMGKVSPGINNDGDSLPCQAGFSYSGFDDLSGRKVCCPKKNKKDDVGAGLKPAPTKTQKILGNLCKGGSDCKESEFCAYTESFESRCGIYNCDGSYVSKSRCPQSELLLADGPEGFFCCPLVYTGEKKLNSSSSSGAPDKGSSSSGGTKKKKKQSSSGAPSEYGVSIVLQTPEIFQAKSLSKNAEIPLLFGNSKSTSSGASSSGSVKPIETHLYRPGEKVSFSIFVKGPSLSKPQDISSYTLSATANQKDSSSKSASLKILELWVEDIVASTDLTNLLSNPPPLNIVLLKQDSKGSFKAANGEVFMLQLPEARYLSNNSGRIVLATPADPTKPIPENKCSSQGGSVCGNDNLGISNCIANGCFNYSKGSQFAKDCCKGLSIGDDVDEVAVSSSGGSGGLQTAGHSPSGSSGQLIPKPTCNKETKEIECKITNKYYIPYCSNRNIPSCSAEGKPLCKSLSSSGESVSDEPSCILKSQGAVEYCKDVSMLLSVNGFDPSDCVNNYCLSIKSIEEKNTCCRACGNIYEKIKDPKIEYSEVGKIKSCVGFDGGYCGSLKNVLSCIDGQCYNYPQNSSEMKMCCSKYDKNADIIKALLTEGGEEEQKGMVYNIIAVGNGSLKIKKSVEDIIGQTFELLLPNDPSIDSVTLRASMKDKKGKTKNAEIKIGLIDGDSQFEESEVVEPEKEIETSPEASQKKENKKDDEKNETNLEKKDGD